MTTIAVTIYVEVQDRPALFEAAVANLIASGVEEADARGTLAPDGEIDSGACARMLLDPGSIPGCSILDSASEEHAEPGEGCAHEWNQTAGEADESGTGIYCLKCGADGDA
jgi:hypothetical protein